MNNRNQIDQFLHGIGRQSVLLIDYDGTLAPFSVDRQSAVPYPGVCSILQEIMDSGRTRLVIVTGRRAEEVNPLLGLHPAPEVWGSHGLQRLRPDGTSEMPEFDPKALQVLADAEPKPGSLAVHWRGLDENAATELRSRILLGWFPIAERSSLTVLEFDGGVELRIPDRDKSDAIRTILQEVGRGTPVAYLGDDMSDEPAFHALQGRGLTVLVRRERRKTAAQAWLKPPEELLDFLVRWRDACRATTMAQTAT